MSNVSKNSLRNFVDQMIPKENLESGYDLRRRSRLTINTAFSLFFFTPVYSLIYWGVYGLPFVGLLIISMGLFCVVAVPVIFKKSGSLAAAVNFMLACFYVLLAIVSSHNGGIKSMTNPWMTALPVLAVMLVGTRWGVLWSCIVIGHYGGYYLLHKYGIPMPHQLPEHTYISSIFSSLTGLTCIYLLLVNLYEAGKQGMLKEVEHHKGLAEIAHQRARLVLDSVDQGFVIVDLDGTLNSEHSKALESIVGPIRGGLTIWEYLTQVSTEGANWLEMAWFQLEMKKLPVSLILKQIPKVIRVNDHNRYLSLNCQYIEQSCKILVVITDISERVQAEQAQEFQSEIIAMVHRVTSYGSVFYESIEELQEVINRLVAGRNTREMEKVLLHTLKGSSAVTGMTSIPRIVHELESKLEDSNGSLDSKELEMLVLRWNALMEKLAPFLKSRDKNRIEIERQDFDRLKCAIEENLPAFEVLNQMHDWLKEPTLVRLQQAADHAKFLAQKLNKHELCVELEDNGIRLEGEKWRAFWATFIHAVRNAVDHGIEDIDTRIRVGKNPQGTVKLITKHENGNLVIKICDDGCGIDWDRVKLIAKEKHLPTDTQEQLFEVLFHTEVTTREQAGFFSGRGVGMAALHKSCMDLGGRIAIESELGIGTNISFVFLKNSDNSNAA